MWRQSLLPDYLKCLLTLLLFMGTNAETWLKDGVMLIKYEDKQGCKRNGIGRIKYELIETSWQWGRSGCPPLGELPVSSDQSSGFVWYGHKTSEKWHSQYLILGKLGWVAQDNGSQNAMMTKMWISSLLFYSNYPLNTHCVPVINLGSNDTAASKTKESLPHAICLFRKTNICGSDDCKEE